MDRFLKVATEGLRGNGRQVRLLPLLAAGLLAASGCAGITNPVADGVRVKHLPQELLVPSKEGEQTIPLTLLRQPPVKTYRLATGDVLGVYVEGYLGDKNQPLPLHVNLQVQPRYQPRLPLASGYPVPVQEDGTVTLPSVAPIGVAGLTLREAREAIRNVYLTKELLRPENDRVFVTLLQPRQYQVLVFRQEATAFSVGLEGPVVNSKRGVGYVLDLPAYENDVGHALAQTGGLPGLDAYNQVIVQRGGFRDDCDRDAILKQLETMRADGDPLKAMVGGEVVRIPLRMPPHLCAGGLTLRTCAAGRECGPQEGPVPFRPEDVILHSGDVVFLEAREQQWFYTGGLLPPGKHLLPRDQDLDVIEAVAQVRGPLINGSFGGSNLSGDLVKPGLGNPSATLLTVVRRMPGGGQILIRVDLGRALNEPSERIRLQAGDVLILQETPGQAFARYFTQTFLNFDVFWQVFRSHNATGVLDASAPDRLPSRVGTILGTP
jgi:protein involved in polysaccharide export with SLBB domain